MLLRRLRPWLAALALCAGVAHARDDTIILSQRGVDRTAVLHRPDGDGALPVVIALHGLASRIAWLRDSLGMDGVAAREGFAVAYPEAVSLSWNYGRPIMRTPSRYAASAPNDLDFLGQLIDRLIADKVADPKRIYLVGVSNGGLMAYAAGCALADRLAAVAALITGMTNHMVADCAGSRALPTLILAGTADTFQGYDGFTAPLGRLLSVPETVGFWHDRNDCDGRRVEVLPKRVLEAPTAVTVIHSTGCRDGAAVAFYRIDGAGHQLPSLHLASGYGDPSFGHNNHDIETAEEVWRFFSRFRR